MRPDVSTTTERLPLLSRRDRIMFTITAIAAVAAGVLHFAHANAVVAFVVAALALATLASLVGRSVEALGDRLGPKATGILQTALGNLPELFVILFALKAGLYGVVKATIVGSILANVLLVLGSGLRGRRAQARPAAFRRRRRPHPGPDVHPGGVHPRGARRSPRPCTPRPNHTSGRCRSSSPSSCWSLFALSLPATLGGKKSDHGEHAGHSGGGSPIAASPDSAKAASEAASHGEWPMAMAIGMLAVAGIGAAFVSEWFVAALEPAMEAAGINEVFAGLVIVAIAGNAVENFVGIQLAAKNQMDYAVQVVLQSPVQIALTIAPIVCLSAGVAGPARLRSGVLAAAAGRDDDVGTRRGAGDLRRGVELVRGRGADRALRRDRDGVLVGLTPEGNV